MYPKIFPIHTHTFTHSHKSKMERKNILEFDILLNSSNYKYHCSTKTFNKKTLSKLPGNIPYGALCADCLCEIVLGDYKNLLKPETRCSTAITTPACIDLYDHFYRLRIIKHSIQYYNHSIKTDKRIMTIYLTLKYKFAVICRFFDNELIALITSFDSDFYDITANPIIDLPLANPWFIACYNKFDLQIFNRKKLEQFKPVRKMTHAMIAFELFYKDIIKKETKKLKLSSKRKYQKIKRQFSEYAWCDAQRQTPDYYIYNKINVNTVNMLTRSCTSECLNWHAYVELSSQQISIANAYNYGYEINIYYLYALIVIRYFNKAGTGIEDLILKFLGMDIILPSTERIIKMIRKRGLY